MTALERILVRATLATALVAAALGLSAPSARAQPCGEDNQKACTVQRLEVYDGYYMATGDTISFWVTEATCKEFLKPDSSGYCHSTQRSAGLICCTKVSYTDNGRQVSEGYYATVDLSEAWIVIPNLEQPGSCNWDATYKNELHSIPHWAQIPIYESRLKINANFFDIENRHPYRDPCTNALGLTVSNKEIVSPVGKVHKTDTQSIAFMTADYTRSHPGVYAIIDSDVIGTYGAANVQNAVSGFRFLNKGVYVAPPTDIGPQLHSPRAAIGLKSDNKTMYLVVVNPGNNDETVTSGGTTAKGLADFLHDELGVYHALMLDGAGSAQLDYFDPKSKTRYRTLPSDKVDGLPDTDRQFRPVPVFLGVM